METFPRFVIILIAVILSILMLSLWDRFSRWVRRRTARRDILRALLTSHGVQWSKTDDEKTLANKLKAVQRKE